MILFGYGCKLGSDIFYLCTFVDVQVLFMTYFWLFVELYVLSLRL